MLFNETLLSLSPRENQPKDQKDHQQQHDGRRQNRRAERAERAQKIPGRTEFGENQHRENESQQNDCQQWMAALTPHQQHQLEAEPGDAEHHIEHQENQRNDAPGFQKVHNGRPDAAAVGGVHRHIDPENQRDERRDRKRDQPDGTLKLHRRTIPVGDDGHLPRHQRAAAVGAGDLHLVVVRQLHAACDRAVDVHGHVEVFLIAEGVRAALHAHGEAVQQILKPLLVDDGVVNALNQQTPIVSVLAAGAAVLGDPAADRGAERGLHAAVVVRRVRAGDRLRDRAAAGRLPGRLRIARLWIGLRLRAVPRGLPRGRLRCPLRGGLSGRGDAAGYNI